MFLSAQLRPKDTWEGGNILILGDSRITWAGFVMLHRMELLSSDPQLSGSPPSYLKSPCHFQVNSASSEAVCKYLISWLPEHLECALFPNPPANLKKWDAVALFMAQSFQYRKRKVFYNSYLIHPHNCSMKQVNIIPLFRKIFLPMAGKPKPITGCFYMHIPPNQIQSG